MARIWQYDQCFKWAGTHWYALVRSTPTSRFYHLAYQDFLQRTMTSHKLPVLFAVLSIPECLSAIRVHYMTDYVTLTCLFLQKWNVTLTLNHESQQFWINEKKKELKPKYSYVSVAPKGHKKNANRNEF